MNTFLIFSNLNLGRNPIFFSLTYLVDAEIHQARGVFVELTKISILYQFKLVKIMSQFQIPSLLLISLISEKRFPMAPLP